MNLQDIQPAIAAIQNNLFITDLRRYTYLSTYPDIIVYTQGIDEIQVSQFQQLAMMAYAWMPRVLRIDKAHLQLAIQAVNDATQTTIQNYQNIGIQNIAMCLHSVVGASKLLHFANPNVFPIWDRKIQAFRDLPNGSYNMSKIQNYIDYVDNTHAIVTEEGFNDFYLQYGKVHVNRLNLSNISLYQVGHLRTIEASAFELAP